MGAFGVAWEPLGKPIGPNLGGWALGKIAEDSHHFDFFLFSWVKGYKMLICIYVPAFFTQNTFSTASV